MSRNQIRNFNLHSELCTASWRTANSHQIIIQFAYLVVKLIFIFYLYLLRITFHPHFASKHKSFHISCTQRSIRALSIGANVWHIWLMSGTTVKDCRFSPKIKQYNCCQTARRDTLQTLLRMYKIEYNLMSLLSNLAYPLSQLITFYRVYLFIQ